MLKINEIFYSIQGEGSNSGLPVIFVRLSGCNLKCKFCDTAHDEGQETQEEQILNEISKFNCRRVAITGGEPFNQDLTKLVNLLKDNCYTVLIETNGTIAVKKELTDKIDWIAMSPKGKIRLSRWDEAKIIVNKDISQQELEKQIIKLKQQCPEGLIFLQPQWEEVMADSVTNLLWTVDLVKEIPQCHLSVQMHKLINIR